MCKKSAFRVLGRIFIIIGVYSKILVGSLMLISPHTMGIR